MHATFQQVRMCERSDTAFEQRGSRLADCSSLNDFMCLVSNRNAVLTRPLSEPSSPSGCAQRRIAREAVTWTIYHSILVPILAAPLSPYLFLACSCLVAVWCIVQA